MMPTFHATCPQCGPVSLTPAQITLWVVRDGSGGDAYAFTCPGCHRRVHKPADAAVARLLRAGGVQPTEAVVHPEAPPVGRPPITADEVVEFHCRLRDEDLLTAHLT